MDIDMQIAEAKKQLMDAEIDKLTAEIQLNDSELKRSQTVIRIHKIKNTIDLLEKLKAGELICKL